MAAVTQPNRKELDSDDDGPEDRTPLAVPSDKGGFFTVYKKGQGIYTRYGTAACVALLIVVLGLFVYEQSNALVQQRNPGASKAIPAGITAAVVAIGSIVAWRLMNAPNSVNFLISTDSEMKKVNWTSREELMGSTKIVILFLFAIALILFLIDVSTGTLFYQMGLIKVPPL